MNVKLFLKYFYLKNICKLFVVIIKFYKIVNCKISQNDILSLVKQIDDSLMKAISISKLISRKGED